MVNGPGASFSVHLRLPVVGCGYCRHCVRCAQAVDVDAGANAGTSLHPQRGLAGILRGQQNCPLDDMLVAFVSNILCLLFGYLYPVYATYKTLKRADPAETKQWLMYWVVISGFAVAELVGDVVLALLPFYNEIKAGFVLWLVLPQTRGATVIYNAYVEKYLAHHEQEIERIALETRQRWRLGVGGNATGSGTGEAPPLVEVSALDSPVRSDDVDGRRYRALQQRRARERTGRRPSATSAQPAGVPYEAVALEAPLPPSDSSPIRASKRLGLVR